MENENNYTIKAVAEKTGLSQHVIRVWERRYSAVEPQRTDTNRRMYSDADVERLQLLQQATLAGHSIGKIANLPKERLIKLLPEKPVLPAEALGPNTFQTQNDSLPHYLGACFEAIKQLNTQALDWALMRASISVSQPVILEKILVPLIHGIGESWREGSLRVMHEHLASSTIRSFLYNMWAKLEIPETAPAMVITTPVGQLHELGALLAAATAASEGWQVTYLGPNLPAEEIVAATEKNNAKAVGLSLVYPANDPRVIQELSKLQEFLRPEVKLFVGGRVVESYRSILNKIKATVITNLPNFREKLELVKIQK